MAYKLMFTDNFERDLDSVLDYFINKLYNPLAAERLYRNVKNTFSTIVEFPEMFPLHQYEPFYKKGYRYYRIGNYLVFYTADDDNKIIYAQAMIYAARDLTKIIE